MSAWMNERYGIYGKGKRWGHEELCFMAHGFYENSCGMEVIKEWMNGWMSG